MTLIIPAAHRQQNGLKRIRYFGWLAITCVLVSGCASIPKQRYGVRSLDIRGMKHMDPESLKVCLGTYEREKPGLDVSTNPTPQCGVKPFDAEHFRLNMPFVWPWSDWPLFDNGVFERDLERVTRWYKARGFYHTRILGVASTPTPAVERNAPFQACTDDDSSGCPVDVSVRIDEGHAVLVEKLNLTGTLALSVELRQKLLRSITLKIDSRFDEAIYEESKLQLLRTLRDDGFAKATVTGRVLVDPKRNRAQVQFDVQAGPLCEFGQVRIRVLSKRTNIPLEVVLRAASIDYGERFSLHAIEDAQRAIYALGAFTSVEVEPSFAEGSNRVNVDINVIPGRLVRYGIGAGIVSGLLTRLEGYDAQDVRQWDIHLLGFAEFRNALGGLERFRIEDRPRMVFSNQFGRDLIPPKFTLGNILTVESRWPDFIEGRTVLVAGAQSDLGPDPYGRNFQRHAADARIGPQRTWRTLGGQLFASLAAHYNLFFPYQDGDFDADPVAPGVQSLRSYRVLFAEQYSALDLRDNSTKPRRGAYFDLSTHLAGKIPNVSSWTYVRVVPDMRGYLPLPLGLVLASRVRVGAMFIVDSANNLDTFSDRLGPYSYRLRGGGASSNRGFLPGYLGDGLEGGLRRWETSLELRIPLTQDFGTLVFADAGDVIDNTQFRFDRPQVSIGLGFRYNTMVGPLRMDFGYRVPSLQTLGSAVLPKQPYDVNLGLFSMPGAFNLTIGEAF